LDVLVPEFLPQVPLDPFTGRPLGCIRSAERVAVYSVGPDLQDGGGAEREAGSSEWDIVFTLRRAPEGAPEETGDE